MKIKQHFNADTLSFAGPIFEGVDGLVRIAIERMKDKSQQEHLTVVLTTTGGLIEVVKRIVETMRFHYRVVDFIIPDYAYSAGTVLAMSGDSIYMNYYSRLAQ